MVVPSWVTVTLELPPTTTSVVASRQLRIYSKAERDADPDVAALVSATVANNVDLYQYDLKINPGHNVMLEVELWHVDNDNRAGEVLKQDIAVGLDHPLVNKLAAPEYIRVLTIDEASSESSESDVSSQS